ncbi:hypothetical protein [Methanoregula sp.]|uniref:hypothetical protein n=1 Tax=Methanoregula sp. TaxID=2052170 RepID=UPI002BDF6FA6|nr:hypothetical protein [Methanoregula sp.]HVP96011.1 hypothetical protein [Methanoregula sp.]
MSSAKQSPISKVQLSYLFFIIGIILMLIPDLNGLGFLPADVRQYFGVLFYPGIICIVIGYILK